MKSVLMVCAMVLALVLAMDVVGKAQAADKKDEKKDVSICVPSATVTDLAVELATTRAQKAQLEVRMSAMQLQMQGLSSTLDNLLQQEAKSKNGDLVKAQAALSDRVVKAMGQDPTKKTFNFETKVIEDRKEPAK